MLILAFSKGFAWAKGLLDKSLHIYVFLRKTAVGGITDCVWSLIAAFRNYFRNHEMSVGIYLSLLFPLLFFGRRKDDCDKKTSRFGEDSKICKKGKVSWKFEEFVSDEIAYCIERYQNLIHLRYQHFPKTSLSLKEASWFCLFSSFQWNIKTLCDKNFGVGFLWTKRRHGIITDIFTMFTWNLFPILQWQ